MLPLPATLSAGIQDHVKEQDTAVQTGLGHACRAATHLHEVHVIPAARPSEARQACAATQVVHDAVPGGRDGHADDLRGAPRVPHLQRIAPG